jgi:alpha-1,3-mannosyltransferase
MVARPKITLPAKDAMSGDTRTILGIPLQAMTTQAAVALLDLNVSDRRATPVAFLNANTAVRATDNPAFSRILQRFVVFNDGLGVNVAHYLKYGSGFPENLNGTDFTPRYLATTRHRFRIFLLGAKPDVVEEAAKLFAGRYPQHEIVGYHHGYFPGNENQDIVRLIGSKAADLLLVAMGNPAQEFWIADNLEATGAVIAFGVGALFDFSTGRFPRAPWLIRRLHAEWMFRLMCEPRRLWKRYTLDNVRFLAYAMGDALRYRLRRR